MRKEAGSTGISRFHISRSQVSGHSASPIKSAMITPTLTAWAICQATGIDRDMHRSGVLDGPCHRSWPLAWVAAAAISDNIEFTRSPVIAGICLLYRCKRPMCYLFLLCFELVARIPDGKRHYTFSKLHASS
jgi:hypothetical protein